MALRWALAENEGGGTLFADERVAERHVGKGAYAGMEFLHVNARTIINTVPAESRMPFRHTINPYRGCSHACVYCFARPTHDYLGLGIGTDFERKIVVKVNAVERLRAELRAPSWDGDHIAMGTNTDPYQHAEGKYHLTRGIVETLSGARNPFSILTKSTLILRDAALLAAACERTEVGVSFSIGTLDRVGLEADRAGHSPAGPPGRGRAPPDRHGHPLRRPGGARAARAVGLRGPADRGGRSLRRRRGGVDLRAWRCTCVAPSGTTIFDWLQGERPDLVRLHRERFRRGGYQPDEERQRIEGIVKVAARRCGVSGRNRYRGTPAGVDGHGGHGGHAGHVGRRRPLPRNQRRNQSTATANCACSEGARQPGVRVLPKIADSCRADRRSRRASRPIALGAGGAPGRLCAGPPGTCGPAVPLSPAAATVPGATNGSYAIVDAAGGVMTFGGAAYDGDTLEVPLAKPIVGGAADPRGGYWLVASDGGVFSFGNATVLGLHGRHRAEQAHRGHGADAGRGRLLAGGLRRRHLLLRRRAVLGFDREHRAQQADRRHGFDTLDGNGYWLVASDGGIFAFGDAPFCGSTGGIHLNQPVVGMAATANGGGYWLVATDGGIFSYGNAQFWGSTGGIHLSEPIVGMTPTQDGNGYWLVGQDAGVFTTATPSSPAARSRRSIPRCFPQPLSNPIPPVVSIINEAPGPQATHQGTQRVAFSGDSLSLYEGDYVQRNNPPYDVDNGAAAGCGYTDGEPTIPWSNPGSVYISPGACALWATQLQWVVSRFHPDVTVIQTGYWETQDRMFNGAYTTLANPAYAAFIQNNLAQAVQIAHSDGGAVILSTSPYFADGTPTTLVDDYNQIVRSVAAQYPYVSIDDLYTVLDPGGAYSSVVDGLVARGPDGVHITEAAVDTLIEPALNQIIANVAGAVYAGPA